MAKKKRSVKKKTDRTAEASDNRAEGFADELFAELQEEYKIDDEDLLDEETAEPEDESPAPKKERPARTKEAVAEVKETEDPSEVEQPPEEAEVEPKIDEKDLPPDDAKAIEALTRLKARLDRNEYGNVWRVFFYEHHGTDAALLLLSGLPSIRELWVMGTKVTAKGLAELKEEMPKLTIYS